MTPQAFLTAVIDPALTLLHSLGGPSPTDAERRMLLAIACQESGLTARYQHAPEATPGPARGWWQFEIGGVEAVLIHPASGDLLCSLCDNCDVVPVAPSIHRAIEGHDILAAGLARLLLWTDPHPVPTDEDGAWLTYVRLWRPGSPGPRRWATSWATALQHVSYGQHGGGGMTGWWRRRKITRAGYQVGLRGGSHNEIPRFEGLAEPIWWLAGWQRGHFTWMAAR